MILGMIQCSKRFYFAPFHPAWNRHSSHAAVFTNQIYNAPATIAQWNLFENLTCL